MLIYSFGEIGACLTQVHNELYECKVNDVNDIDEINNDLKKHMMSTSYKDWVKATVRYAREHPSMYQSLSKTDLKKAALACYQQSKTLSANTALGPDVIEQISYCAFEYDDGGLHYLMLTGNRTST